MENDQRIAELEEQLGTVLNAMQIIAEQKKNADLSAENQALRQALANSIDALQKNVGNAISKLDSYQQVTSQKLALILEAEDKTKENVRQEIARLLPSLNAEIENSKKRLSESVSNANAKLSEMGEASVTKLSDSAESLVGKMNSAIGTVTKEIKSLEYDARAAKNLATAGLGKVTAIILGTIVIGAVLGFFVIGSFIPIFKWYPETVKTAITNSDWLDTAWANMTDQEQKDLRTMHNRKAKPAQ